MTTSRTDNDDDSSMDDEGNKEGFSTKDDNAAVDAAAAAAANDDDDDNDEDCKEEEDYSGSKIPAKRPRREKPNQAGPTGSTAAVNAPVQVPSATTTAQAPLSIEEMILTDDNALRITLERYAAKLRLENAEIEIQLSDARECLKHVRSNNHAELQRTFQRLQESSSNVLDVLSLKDNFDTIEEKLKTFIQDCKTSTTANKQLLLETLKSLNATVKPDLDTRNRDGMDITEAKKNDPESGLFYVQDIHWIGLQEGPTNEGDRGIGILEPIQDRSRQTFRPRQDIDTLQASDMLTLAFTHVNNTNSEKEVIDQLVELLTSLDAPILRSAWDAFQVALGSDNIRDMGEMALQQHIYPPFARLFRATVGSKTEARYKADQDVKSSLSIQFKEEKGVPNFEPRKVILQPDGAALMHDEGWDVLGMMELKDGNGAFDRAYRIDYDKCTLLTAISAVAMARCIEKKDYGHVAIPFLIAKGGNCSLFATTLDEAGNPCIKVVGYPDGHRALGQTFKTASCQARKEIFTALAVLLNEFKGLFDKYETSYKTKMELRTPALDPVTKLTLNSRKSDNTKDSRSKKTQSTGNPGRGKSNEQSAIEAADCGGQFVNLTSLNPSIRTLRFPSTSIATDEHEHEHSPYFFTALPASSSSSSSSMVLTKNQVFLKVWNADDVKMDSVQAEWRHYKQALDARVPVAAPALAEVAISTSSSGSKYLVIAVEYIQQDEIRNMEDLAKFCYSLVDTVDRLHNQAKLLHCDLKPDNIRWRHGVVRLIDFGHARPISSAKCVRGTEGFEAPEILNGKHCSTKTDAFAVGKTIMAMLKELDDKTRPKSGKFRCLGDVALKLTHADPQSRWSLKQALERIQTIVLSENDSFASIKITKLAANPVTASPSSMLGSNVQAKRAGMIS